MTALTTVVEVFGERHRHRWLDAATRQEDAYSVFLSRAELLGWSTSGPRGPLRWGMNDAALGNEADDRVAWFQVDQTPSDVRGAAIVPLLTCAGDAAARFGRLDLSAIRTFLPDGPFPSGLGDLVAALNWFELCAPDLRTATRVTVEGSGALVGSVESLATFLGCLNVGAFELTDVALDGDVDAEPPTTPLGLQWLEGERCRLAVSAVVPEPSFEAYGWIIALVWEALRTHRDEALGPVVVRLDVLP
jgi:hypothetical protein